MAMSRSQQEVPENLQTINENSETQDNQEYMTWEEIIGVGDTTSEEDVPGAAAQEPNTDEDAEDGENSQENAENGES